MKKNNKIFITGAIIIAINILIVFVLILPAHERIQTDFKEYLKQKKALAMFREELANFKDFDTKAVLYKSDLEKMYGLIRDQVFIDKELPVNFMTFLEEEAQERGLSIKITPVLATRKENDLFNSIDFRLNIEGQFPALLEFVKKIENWQWLVETKLLSITKNEQEEYISSDILIKAYVRD